MTDTPAQPDPAARAIPPATDEEQIIDFHSDFWENHKGKIIAIGAVVVLAILGVAWWQFTEESTRSAAADAFAQAKSLEDYEAIARNYPGSPVAAEALLLAADLLAAESKYDEARARLEELIAKHPEHSLISGAHLRRALLAESSGKPEQAISELRAVVSDFPGSYAAPIASLNLVRLLDAQGKTAEATAILQRFGASHTGSIFIGEAEMEMRFRSANAPLPPPEPVRVIHDSATPVLGSTNSVPASSGNDLGTSQPAKPADPVSSAPSTEAAPPTRSP